MKTTKKPQTWYEQLESRYQAELKRLKKKKFLLKAKFFLLLVLPIVILLLTVKVLRTFIRIRLRAIFAHPKNTQPKAATPTTPTTPTTPPTPVPAKTTPIEKQFIQPEPVDTTMTENS